MQKKSHTPFFSPPADEKKAHCGPMTRREGDSKSRTRTKNAHGEKRSRMEKKFLCAGKQFLHMKKQTKREQATTEPVHAEFSAVKKEVKAVSAEFFREEIKI